MYKFAHVRKTLIIKQCNAKVYVALNALH